MLSKVKRKLSRTKSVSDPPAAYLKYGYDHGLSLTPSDEALINNIRLASQPEMETETESQPPAVYQPPVDTHQSERKVFNNIDHGFLALPTEILLCLKDYLRPSGEVALRHCCSRFFYLYSMPSFYLTGDEKFDFICMTERDQDANQLDRLVCGRCRELHARSSFPSAEITLPPLERDCQQIWLCAHRSMGYQKTVRSLKAGAESPFRAETLDPCSKCREVIRNRSVSDRPEKGTSQTDVDSPNTESLLVSKVALLQRHSPIYNTRHIGGSMYKEIFGVRDVSAALQALDFRICPHIKLGDPCILSKFCRSCLNTQMLPPGVKGPPCISAWNQDSFDSQNKGRCRGTCFDRSCKTKWMFQARESLQPDSSGRRPVWLIIVAYRWLGPLVSTGADKSWRDHAIVHEDRVAMRKSWDQWIRGMTPMPNWSVCLWLPEDCDLR